MSVEKYQEGKEWEINGFTEEQKRNLDIKLMENRYSYWFRYRSIPWYRRRRIKGTSPQYLIKMALKELNLEGNVKKLKRDARISSYWIIENKSSNE